MRGGVKEQSKRFATVMVGDEAHAVRSLEECDYLVEWLKGHEKRIRLALERAAEVRALFTEGKS